MSSRSTSVLPPESCLNWHLTPKDAARLFCKRLDSVQPPPTPSDLIVDRSEQGDLSTVDRRRSGSGYHRRKDDYSFDPGVERAEQLLTLGDFVARRLLEASLTLGPSEEERSITNACRLAFKINALKWLQCQAYSDALRQAAAGQSAIISKPRFCSNRQAAERTLNGYRGAQDPKRPLLAVSSIGQGCNGSLTAALSACRPRPACCRESVLDYFLEFTRTHFCYLSRRPGGVDSHGSRSESPGAPTERRPLITNSPLDTSFNRLGVP